MASGGKHSIIKLIHAHNAAHYENSDSQNMACLSVLQHCSRARSRPGGAAESTCWGTNTLLRRSMSLGYPRQVSFSDKSNLLGQVSHDEEAKCYTNLDPSTERNY